MNTEVRLYSPGSDSGKPQEWKGVLQQNTYIFLRVIYNSAYLIGFCGQLLQIQTYFCKADYSTDTTLHSQK
jgi:hypothetical protein